MTDLENTYTQKELDQIVRLAKIEQKQEDFETRHDEHLAEIRNSIKDIGALLKTHHDEHPETLENCKGDLLDHIKDKYISYENGHKMFVGKDIYKNDIRSLKWMVSLVGSTIVVAVWLIEHFV